MKRLPYPFPGMNPYLEHRVLWEPVHVRLAIEIADQLQPLLDPRYVAAVEERVYVEGPRERKPDVWVEKTTINPESASAAAVHGDTAIIVEVPAMEVKERRIEILDLYEEMKLVAAIEIVSPSNKKKGPGRRSYEEKQEEFLSRDCHLIEIDFVRNGTHVVSVPSWRADEVGAYDYLVCVSRWPDRERFELYPRSLRDRLPVVNIPLVAPDNDAPLDLQAAIEEVYHKARFGLRLRYDKPCVPPLPKVDQEWAYEQLEKAGIREKVKKPRSANGKKKKS
jgi:hypothetical protein